MTTFETGHPDGPTHDAGQNNGPQEDPQTTWMAMPSVPDAEFPPLQSVVARPVVQDRWERLVTEVMIPETADRVWDALTEPDAAAEWLAVCRGHWAKEGAESMLDFEDGEFFYCRTETARPVTPQRAGVLRYLWRWAGIGPAAVVTWQVRQHPDRTVVTVTEEAFNPPSDWRSWNGMGWPGILEQLAGYLRTGLGQRWPWRRMGPYIQAVVPAPPFEAWEALTSERAVKHWLQRSHGSLAPGDPMTVVMGDASGTVVLEVTRSVEAAQEFPSYLPYLEFEVRRTAWERALGGRLWIEPAGVGAQFAAGLSSRLGGAWASGPADRAPYFHGFLGGGDSAGAVDVRCDGAAGCRWSAWSARSARGAAAGCAAGAAWLVDLREDDDE
ncbi:MAG: hypothetical protein GEV11_25180 [Streptosporangiales bacterium]|nr:hypothetical protein [Streptosporangiales bacterium]